MPRPLSRLLAAVIAGLVLAAVLAFLDGRPADQESFGAAEPRTGVAR